MLRVDRSPFYWESLRVMSTLSSERIILKISRLEWEPQKLQFPDDQIPLPKRAAPWLRNLSQGLKISRIKIYSLLRKRLQLLEPLSSPQCYRPMLWRVWLAHLQGQLPTRIQRQTHPASMRLIPVDQRNSRCYKFRKLQRRKLERMRTIAQLLLLRSGIFRNITLKRRRDQPKPGKWSHILRTVWERFQNTWIFKVRLNPEPCISITRVRRRN